MRKPRPSPRRVADRVRVTGPLVPFVSRFRAALMDAGYTPLSAVNQVRLLAHLSRWLDANRLGVPDLTDERVAEFLAARRARGCTWSVSRGALAPLLGLLAELGVRPAVEQAAPASPTDMVLTRFHRYLLDERGLAASTADAYVHRARRFLARCAPDGRLDAVTAGDVTRAVLAASATSSVGSAQYVVAALRAFLRFCNADGLVAADLSAAALALTGRRRSSLPQGITSADATALLCSCDRRAAVGRRDHAVILTLVRLGLRAGEVARLRLDDVDWRAGELVVRGKGRRESRLPLPADVGGAIAAYLRRGRPTSRCREVFLRATAPVAPLGRGGVSSIVRRACRRAGVTPFGAHRLRHTLACGMVKAGVPLTDIGQVLRHRSLVSTAIYARVDVDQLRGLARSWPAGSAR